MPQKRLAITISGAVSLGSYEAGVLFEVLRALKENNISAPNEQIIIDVLTGASAGGMTAVTAAQKLLYDAGALENPYDNVFYNTWVKDISLDRLLALEQGEKTGFSFFSSNAIEAIADDYITGKFRPKIPYRRHPAVNGSLKLGLALSNLVGVDYAYPIARKKGQSDNNTFDYTSFEDQKIGEVMFADKPDSEVIKDWEPWRDAAVACGAFPFAFRVKDLIRVFADFKGSPHLVDWPQSPRNFAYTDGGLFQNEPLGMAKNLVDIIDGHLENDSRFYLFVAPGSKNGVANSAFTATQATLVKTAEALIGAVLNQARFQDWIEAESLNTQIELFDTRARQLFQGVLDDKINPADLQPAADALLPPLLSLRPQANAEPYNKAVHRLSNQFKNETEKLSAKSPAALKAWVDSILVLELAAELGSKDEMTIYGITAKEEELFGHPFFAFQGFFDIQFRHHDYNVGRQKAQEFLQNHRSPGHKKRHGSDDTLPELGPIHCKLPDDIFTFDDVLGKGLIPKTSALTNGDSKDRLLKAIMERVDAILADLEVPFLLRGPLKWFVIEGKIRQFLDSQLAASRA
jgi:hypothetical protein